MYLGSFKRALPKHIPIEKFVRVAETAILSNPSIMDCSKQSVLQSLTKAAQDGLLIDGREAAIVTFNNKGIQTAQYMPMIGGILKKVTKMQKANNEGSNSTDTR